MCAVCAVIVDKISIHALREEGDSPSFRHFFTNSYFYPRPPRGGRLCNRLNKIRCEPFLSTPSARRATYRSEFCLIGKTISIHALREEGDRHIPQTVSKSRKFLSTPSARRATLCALSAPLLLTRFLSTPSARRATPPRFGIFSQTAISIHALREEGDCATD